MTRRHEAGSKTTSGALAFALACVAVACLSGPMIAWQETDDGMERARMKLDRMLQGAVDAHRDETVRVIIRAAAGELDALRAFVEESGHDVVHEFTSIEALTVKLTVGDLLELATDPVVASVSSDGKLGPDPVHRDSRTLVSPGTRAVLIKTAPGRLAHVVADLEMHHDEVTTTNHETHVIGARVHAGDIAVLARNPSVVSIVVEPSRQSRR